MGQNKQSKADQSWMDMAVKAALDNPRAPFGAVLLNVNTQKVVATGVNRSSENPVFHGEIVAMNQYAQTRENNWNSLCLYTTAEPCCMCQSAILWAGIPRVVFGTSISTLVKLNWNQFSLTALDVVQAAGFAECQIVGGVLENECDQLFRDAQAFR